MGVMEKFKNFIGVPDDEFYEEEDDFDFIGSRSDDRGEELGDDGLHGPDGDVDVHFASLIFRAT